MVVAIVGDHLDGYRVDVAVVAEECCGVIATVAIVAVGALPGEKSVLGPQSVLPAVGIAHT